MTLVAITSGGPRKHALLSQFQEEGSVWNQAIAKRAFGDSCDCRVPGFRLEFVEAVNGEACRTRDRLEALAGDVVEAFGLSASQRDRMGELCSKMRPGNRRVLGCLLANLRAMRCLVAQQRPAMIIEDNVRVARRADCADLCARGIDAFRSGGVDLLYVGHLGHDDTLALIAAQEGLALPPETKVQAKGDKPINHELWGTYAYVASKRLLDAVFAAVRDDFPRRLFFERRRDVDVTPADKLLQRVARDNNFTIRAMTPPLFFRMPPVIRSKIHTKYDEPFLVSTTLQLKLYNMTWDHVWLTPDERDKVNHHKSSSESGDDSEKKQKPEEEEDRMQLDP